MDRRPILVCSLLALAVAGVVASDQSSVPIRPAAAHDQAAAAQPAGSDDPQTIVTRTCVMCHNDRTKNGNLSLQAFQVENAAADAEVAEHMIRKLRAGQMPPA